MTSRQVLRYFSSFCMIAVVGIFAAGCTIQDPPAFGQLNSAHDALASAKKAGADKKFPDEFTKLEKQYEMARGTLYACQDAKAGEMALALILDANTLATKKPVTKATKKIEMQTMPANTKPLADLVGPTSGMMNQLLTFDASSSSDVDENDKLSYKWDFGDGATADFTFPIATHRYKESGIYTVYLMVDDGQGGKSTAQQQVLVEAPQARVGIVHFNTNSALLSNTAKSKLMAVVDDLQSDTPLTATIAGHTDSVGTNQFNQALSDRRANAVRGYLISQGIASNRLSVQGHGEVHPIGDNETQEGRAENRRVEITW